MSAPPLAAALLRAHREGSLAVARFVPPPASVAEAYEIQSTVLGALAPGVRPTAWKVSPPRPGEEPLASPVPPPGVHPSPATLARGAAALLGIECEVAFRFLAAPTPSMGRDDLARITEARVLVELCATRFDDPQAAAPLARLADFQSHAAFVLGNGIRDWDAIDFTRQAVALEIAGREPLRREGSHPTCDLAAMLAWAVGHCAARGWPLGAHDVVTTGTWTGMVPLGPGEEAVATFAGIGAARLALS